MLRAVLTRQQEEPKDAAALAAGEEAEAASAAEAAVAGGVAGASDGKVAPSLRPINTTAKAASHEEDVADSKTDVRVIPASRESSAFGGGFVFDFSDVERRTSSVFRRPSLLQDDQSQCGSPVSARLQYLANLLPNVPPRFAVKKTVDSRQSSLIASGSSFAGGRKPSAFDHHRASLSSPTQAAGRLSVVSVYDDSPRSRPSSFFGAPGNEQGASVIGGAGHTRGASFFGGSGGPGSGASFFGGPGSGTSGASFFGGPGGGGASGASFFGSPLGGVGSGASFFGGPGSGASGASFFGGPGGSGASGASFFGGPSSSRGASFFGGPGSGSSGASFFGGPGHTRAASVLGAPGSGSSGASFFGGLYRHPSTYNIRPACAHGRPGYAETGTQEQPSSIYQPSSLSIEAAGIQETPDSLHNQAASPARASNHGAPSNHPAKVKFNVPDTITTLRQGSAISSQHTYHSPYYNGAQHGAHSSMHSTPTNSPAADHAHSTPFNIAPVSVPHGHDALHPYPGPILRRPCSSPARTTAAQDLLHGRQASAAWSSVMDSPPRNRSMWSRQNPDLGRPVSSGLAKDHAMPADSYLGYEELGSSCGSEGHGEGRTLSVANQARTGGYNVNAALSQLGSAGPGSPPKQHMQHMHGLRAGPSFSARARPSTAIPTSCIPQLPSLPKRPASAPPKRLPPSSAPSTIKLPTLGARHLPSTSSAPASMYSAIIQSNEAAGHDSSSGARASSKAVRFLSPSSNTRGPLLGNHHLAMSSAPASGLQLGGGSQQASLELRGGQSFSRSSPSTSLGAGAGSSGYLASREQASVRNLRYQVLQKAMRHAVKV